MDQILKLDKQLRAKDFTSGPYTFRVYAAHTGGMIALVITVKNAVKVLDGSLISAAVGVIGKIIRSTPDLADWYPEILINKIWLDMTGHEINWMDKLASPNRNSNKPLTIDTPPDEIENRYSSVDFEEYNRKLAAQLTKLNKVVYFFNEHLKHFEVNKNKVTLRASCEPGIPKLNDDKDMLPTFTLNINAVAKKIDDDRETPWNIKMQTEEMVHHFFKNHSVVPVERLILTLNIAGQTSTYKTGLVNP
jgi:hypothetical protein